MNINYGMDGRMGNAMINDGESDSALCRCVIHNTGVLLLNYQNNNKYLKSKRAINTVSGSGWKKNQTYYTYIVGCC